MAISRGQHKDVEFCTACPKLCRHACPVSNAECRETVTPWGKMTMLNLVDSGAHASDPDNCSLFYKCLGCLLCRSYCVHEIAVPHSLSAGRALAIECGAAPPGIAALKQAFVTSGNPAGKAPQEVIRELLPPEHFEKGVGAVFFGGCTHTLRSPGIITKFFASAAKLGVDYLGAWDGAGRSPYCCGLPLFSAGFVREFRAHAEKVASALSAYKLVVTPCPACAYALRALYPEQGIDIRPKVRHAVEFLLPLLEASSARLKKSGRRFAFHDPCYLGRHLGLYDEPRRALYYCGAEVAEFQWNRENAYCCGAGGNLPLTSPGTARAIAGARRGHFKKIGADAIATACPSCEAMLRREGSGVEVVDVVDVVYDAVTEH
ncbi:MAG: (Fe-S)-binding protein [Deltaproteobacteria bacterium]|nr:(Fe-S)-binding protein [Deltaproteobacteria bacterium]